MALYLSDVGVAPDWLDEWPLGVSPAFIRSRAYDVLRRDLGRYLRREVNGRSFLIAGHRGAGKTSMVVRAVDDARREALYRSVAPPPDPASVTDETPQLPLQRPLLVKLHGPSLLSLDPPAKPATPTPTPPPPADPDVPVVPADAAAPPPPQGKPAAPKKPEPPVDPASRALVQITIALYRALAREAGEAYGIHARELERIRAGGEVKALQAVRGGGDHAELAGQLILDLDRAAEPATLRAFWSRLDRLDRGVLWPRSAAWQGREGSYNDQGISELVALSTASQAFKRCLGELKESDSDSDTAQNDESLTATTNLDLADLSNKLIGLAAGAGVTAALSSGGVNGPAVAAGVATGLVSAMTLNWSHTRSLKRQRTRTYSFIRDTTVQTLDRDLPLVIERLRAAGLAPVFVVDELDKVTDVTKQIGELIGRLKHLTTDFGFFCFLTDRDYYEYILRSLRTEAFPREHTYFSERQFILYGPSEFKAYLSEVVKSTAKEGAALDDDLFDAQVFALLLLHRSKLNTVDVVRELAKSCDAAGNVRPTTTRLGSDLGNQLQTTVQLAIDHILRGEAVKARVEGEPIFAQLAIDALYRISRAWEDEARTVTLGADPVVTCLAERIRRKAVADLTAAKAAVAEVIGEVDLRLIQEQVGRLEGYLGNLAQLRADLMKELPPEGELILDLIPDKVVSALLATDGEASGTARFTHDVFGRPIPREGADAAAAPPDPAVIDRLVEVVDEFEKMLQAARLPPEDLARVGLLPRTVVWSEVQQARALMAVVPRAPTALADQRAKLAVFEAAVRDRGAFIYNVLAVAWRARAAAGQGPEDPLSPALAAVARYRNLATEAQQRRSAAGFGRGFTPPVLFDSTPVRGALAERLRVWTARLEGLG